MRFKKFASCPVGFRFEFVNRDTGRRYVGTVSRDDVKRLVLQRMRKKNLTLKVQCAMQSRAEEFAPYLPLNEATGAVTDEGIREMLLGVEKRHFDENIGAYEQVRRRLEAARPLFLAALLLTVLSRNDHEG